jgi:hypothetical protein
MLGIGFHVRQAVGILLSQLLGPVLLRKLTLKEGDLSDKTFSILTSRGQRRGILRLHSRYPLPCLCLCQGGPILCIFNTKGGAIPCCSSLLGRSLYNKYHHDMGSLRSSGYLPRPDHLHQQHRHARASLAQELQKHHIGGDEREWRKPEAHEQDFLSFIRLTRIRRRMFWPAEASVSCSNLSAETTYEHVYIASSHTLIQSISRGEKLGEPCRGSPDTPGLTVPEDPEAGAASPRAALPGDKCWRLTSLNPATSPRRHHLAGGQHHLPRH